MTDQPKVALFLIDGFEETEALTTVDLLRRGGVHVVTVSLGKEKRLCGRHSVVVQADAMFCDALESSFDMLVIPGGTIDYTEHQGLLKLVREYGGANKLLAAICAAPAVFGKLGLLNGKKAVCYPGMEDWLKGAILSEEIVVTDGNITTSKGPGTAVYFALRLIELLRGKSVADEVARQFIVQKIA